VRTRLLIAATGALAAMAVPVPAGSAREPARFNPQPRETPALARAKERAERALPAPSRRAAPSAAPRTQLFGGLDFAGLGAAQNASWAGFTPPDSTGAIGPDNYVELVNSQIGIYNTAGTPLQSDDLQSFLIDNFHAPSTDPTDAIVQGTSHDSPGDSIFDVQVQWDQHSQRWLIASDDVETGGDSHLVFGWSKSTDPATGWCVYRTDATSTFDDFPKLGHNDTFLLIGTNRFASSNEPSASLGARVFAIPKPPNGTITTCDDRPAITTFQPSAFTPVPVNITDDSATGYVVATGGTASSSLRLYTISGPAGSPVMNGPVIVPVAPWSVPPNVQQPGTASVLDSADGRLTQAVADRNPPSSGNEHIWTQHAVRSADGQRAEVRWYELDAVSGARLQEGTVSDPSNSVFNASISPAADGTTAALQYNVGGRFHQVEMRGQTRLSATPAGTMENEQTLGVSDAIDSDFTCTEDGGPCRWGDYSGASPDPDPTLANTHVVWGTNQLTGPADADNPSWLTRNFALTPGGQDPAPSATADGFPFTSSSPTPVFNFASSETGSTFRCSIDGGAFAPCTPGAIFGPALANGNHSFHVLAIDASGQAGAPATPQTFTIAAPLPDTLLDSGPLASGHSRSASFAFHSTKAGSSFQCSLDGSAFAACASPHVTGRLSAAQHAFAVRALDAQGNADPTPAASSFRVVLAAASARVRSQRAGRTGLVAVRVSCPRSREQTCPGSVTLERVAKHRTRLASHRFRVRAGRTTTVHVRLTRRARKLLAGRHRLRVKALFRFSSPTKRTSRTFRLSAPRRS
jgi:hypothetical protein